MPIYNLENDVNMTKADGILVLICFICTLLTVFASLNKPDNFTINKEVGYYEN